METIPVVVKHQGKRHELDIDLHSTGEVFKSQLFSLTGVEPERQKIVVKGGQLKDDTNLSTLGLKPGHIFMMMGTPASVGSSSEVLQKPKEKIRFVEDMTEAEAAKAHGATPAGLQNLGNTCYLNSTLQALRAVPELQEELAKYKASSAGGPSGGASASSALSDLSQFGLGGLGATMDLTASLRDLFQQMSETQEGFPPLMFLNALRTSFPQFAQKAKTGPGYAQQDAEEAWSQILSQLRQKLKIKDSAGDNSSSDDSGQQSRDISFIDKYFAGKFETLIECDEPAAKEAGEEAVKGEDVFLKLDCHIGFQTNHLRDGILAALEEKIEKKSPKLDRDAIYTKKSRISRLPKYLTVHFVRFYWKREIRKKAKIMKKVTFPQELDVVEFCTEQLRSLLIPVRDKIRDVRKEEQEVERAKKRQKRIQADNDSDKTHELKGTGPSSEQDLAKEKGTDTKVKPKSEKGRTDTADTEMPDVNIKTDAELEAERAASIQAAKKELLSLVNPELDADDGANKTGLYELRGVVTHQGASADSGHYTAYVKKDRPKESSTGNAAEDDGKWWWFNDDKVSEVDADKVETLSGGGESHSALILLYRAIPLPSTDEVK